jgi:uncharacterized repeat protein (TIGR01451 family)
VKFFSPDVGEIIKFQKEIDMNIFNKIITCISVTVICLSAVQAFGQGVILSQPSASYSSYFLDAAVAPDGNIYAVNTNGGATGLFKVTASGVALWQFSLDGYGKAKALQAVNDNGVAVLMQSDPAQGSQAYRILRYNAAGQLQWEAPLGNPGSSNGLISLEVTADGGFIAAGNWRNAQNEQELWLVKTGSNGAIHWSQHFGIPGLNIEAARIVALNNDRFAIGGTVLNTGVNRDFYLAIVTDQGVLVSQTVYNKPGYQVFSDLLQAPDGSITLLGVTQQVEPNKTAMLSVSANGVEQWFKNINTTQTFPGSDGLLVQHSFCVTPEGHYIIPVSSSDVTSIALDFYLFETDAEGNPVSYATVAPAGFARRCRYVGGDKVLLAGRDQSGGVVIITGTDGNQAIGRIEGDVYLDNNLDCQLGAGENLTQSFLVEARNAVNASFYGTTDASGHYSIQVLPGTYQIRVHAQTPVSDFYTACDTPSVLVSNTATLVDAPAIGVQPGDDGAFLQVELSAGFFRRCMNGSYYVSYCNYGNQTATSVQVVLQADPALDFVSNSEGTASIDGQTWTIHLPDLPAGACNTLQIGYTVSCDAVLGQTICSEAHIFPDDVFLKPDPGWDGSNLVITGDCNNGTPQFRIKNNGSDMVATSEYIIIEDNIMYSGHFRLDAGEDTLIAPQNQTLPSYYLRAYQNEGHPARQHPALSIYDCNSNPGANLMLDMGSNPATPVIDQFCDAVIGSFDPNDKRGLPFGQKAEHFIEPDQVLNYMIRFQNTGTDTAFTVRIDDVLPAQLDPSSVQFLGASHACSWNIVFGNMLRVQFDQILLPDSNVNEPASHGYVLFRIQPKPNLPLGTVIVNKADIYFDFNEPVVTDPWIYTLGQPLLSAVAAESDLPVWLAPNPASDVVHFQCPDASGPLQFRVYNPQGKLLQSQRYNKAGWTFHCGHLPAGLYVYQISDARGKTATGRIILR